MTFLLVWVLPQFIFKGSKTIGKKIIGISVKNTYGYNPSFIQIVTRNVFSYFNMSCLLIFTCFLSGGINSGWMYPVVEIHNIGISLFSILIILFIMSIISFCVSIINKKKKSIHDFIVDTICVDDRNYLDLETRLQMMKDDKNEDNIIYYQSTYFDSSSFNNFERKDKYKE